MFNLEMIKNLAFENRYLLMCILAVLVYAILEFQNFQKVAYALMLQAKSMAKDYVLKSGSAQADWVVDKLYIVLPRRITIFISRDNMHKLVNYFFRKARDYMDNGRFDNSVK